MSSVDLNIVERGLNGQAWTAERGRITAGDLNRVQEQRTNNSSALNALPTPFARFFVAKEAFRRVFDEARDANRSAGEAYRHMVSDILDVYELLYNLTFHESRWESNKRQIAIKEWNYDSDLSGLRDNVPILGNAVANYFDGDLGVANGRLFFVVLYDEGREYLLAASSPFTGFVTPPDLDKKFDSRNRDNICFMGQRYMQMPQLARKAETGGCYFRQIRMLGERDKEFKNYMFHLVDTLPAGNGMNELRDYVRQVANTDREIIRDWQPQLKPIMSDNSNQVIVNGLVLQKDDSLSTVNFFNDTLVRLPFRLSGDFYRTMDYVGGNDDRDYDFLMPLSLDAIARIDGDFECECWIMAACVRVSITYCDRVFTKDYYSDPVDGRGRIVDLARENISFNLAVFPNILSQSDADNNYFKVMAVLNDATTDRRRVDIDCLDVSFFFRDDNGRYQEIETIDADNAFARFGVRPAVVRSRQDEHEGVAASSKFYEIFETSFDAIHLRLALSGRSCEGLLLPRWTYAQRTDDTYTYAIDLGTTNTYISCRKQGQDLAPEQLKMHRPMVAFLPNFAPSVQHPLVRVIEATIEPQCRKTFNTELLPALIDGDAYRFPIRTALCVRRDDPGQPELFDNCNIAFFYERQLGLANQSILTNIKWESGYEKQLRLFIRELLLIIKADILQKNGAVALTNIVWFRPLSFRGGVRDLYASIWREEVRNVLRVGEDRIKCISESEAPYHYFRRADVFRSVQAVSIVDIGGGSTDFMYFADGSPKLANSVHFGCDVLWGNGFSGFVNSRENGIYQRFADNLHLGAPDDELEQLNARMKADTSMTTKDIINFWISNDHRCGITRSMRDAYKPLFLYHFASIVYFMASMYRCKQLPCPRSVLFCGNGSRYVDGLITSDRSLISRLVATVFESVYGEAQDVQVILPEQRKECTCYGGLYRTGDADSPAEFNFQGVSDREYASVGQLRRDFDDIKRQLLLALDRFNGLYRQLLGMLMQSGEIGNRVDTDAIISLVSTGLEDSIERNFRNQVVEKFNDSEMYHDSVFFLPIIDNIFKLTSQA